MTYVKVLHTDVADQRWLAAGPEGFALHVAATVWCDRQLNDGFIPLAIARRGALATTSPSDTDAAIAALVAEGFWTEEAGGYRLVDFLEHAFPAEQVKRTRARWSEDKARRRQHGLGDHSLCKDPKYCEYRRTHPLESTATSTVEATSGRSRLDQTRPDQTRPDRRSGSGSQVRPEGGSAGATPPRFFAQFAHTFADDSSGQSCLTCGLGPNHAKHSRKAIDEGWSDAPGPREAAS